jgi:hypothetical protein
MILPAFFSTRSVSLHLLTNGVDEMLSCFCDHCRLAAKAVDLDLDSVAAALANRAIDPTASLAEGSAAGASAWLDPT